MNPQLVTRNSQPSSPIYCDQAATSFPKPERVITAVNDFLTSCSGSPGRSAHRFGIDSGRQVFETRELLADFFHCASSDQVIFTSNATEALNLVLLGLLEPGDHVITTSIEHNSVMRPLQYLKEARGVDFSIAACDAKGGLDPGDIKRALQKKTRLLVVNHASNVTGTILPVEEVAAIKDGALLLVDAAQSAGVLPIDMEKMGIDFLAFTGHKSLFGPTGTGGLCLARNVPLTPLKRGGTGSRSESWTHPEFLPDRHESGTPNTLGIAGLKAGLEFIIKEGLDRIRRHELELIQRLYDGLSGMKRVKIYGPNAANEKTAVISLNIDGKKPSEVCLMLDKEHAIMTRGGLQCAPAAHKTIGTFPEGTVRVSLGYFNTAFEVEEILKAIDEIGRM
ncbi:MAG: aminotransferase class V-fold PLP-dependent enzyme [Pseudomonadota bacterium]